MKSQDAFPLGNDSHPQFRGMQLRDYFAAHIIQGMMASPELLQIVTSKDILKDTCRSRCAFVAYQYADALMKERESE